MPLDLWKSLIATGELVGPQGGVVLHGDRLPRHRSNTNFVALVREGWIGSRGATSDLLQQVISESLHSGRSVTLARSFEDAHLARPGETEIEEETLFDKLARRESQGGSSDEVINFDDLMDEL